MTKITFPRLLTGAIALTAILFVGGILAPGLASAHHSFSMFERDKKVEKAGVIKNVEWSNPHVWIYILATNEQGVQEEWGFECGPTNMLLRSGWKRDTLKPGDKVTINFRPMKNGTHAGSLRTIAREDGTLLDMVSQGAKPEDGELQPQE
jgi:hypothetical protein